ncbi:TMV resistance protein N [Vitis vinifera]|uniref:ADP-ribosyl cyclase/cyclic ADP-ribose hydrolase n=1 Tax=Vitis vinifera TaxID=29760 RepID=A0A438DCL4_VITVI|nr:TMV resistance protein N [Vitis vinifera]
MISSGIASSSTTASAATCVLDGSYDILYDVFLSFRGEDTRKSFADHLYTALNGKRIHTFRDEEEIRMGEALAPAISKAIKGSRVFIVIFSKNFADFGWCLNELDEIMECRRITGRIVYPIFYHVDPSHVRKQEGDYGTPFSLYEENADKEKAKIKRWKAALREALSVMGMI